MTSRHSSAPRHQLTHRCKSAMVYHRMRKEFSSCVTSRTSPSILAYVSVLELSFRRKRNLIHCFAKFVVDYLLVRMPGDYTDAGRPEPGPSDCERPCSLPTYVSAFDHRARLRRIFDAGIPFQFQPIAQPRSGIPSGISVSVIRPLAHSRIIRDP